MVAFQSLYILGALMYQLTGKLSGCSSVGNRPRIMRNGEIPNDEPVKRENKCCQLIRNNKLVVFLICCIIISIAVGVLQIAVVSSLLVEKERYFRLPDNLIPSHYAIEIKPYMTPGNFKFEGTIEISLTCARKTDEIVLHSSGLDINEDAVSVEAVDSKERLKVLRIKYDEENEFLILQLFDDLKQNGTYRVFISYQGVLEEKAIGFYVSSYTNDDNVTYYTASTKFKPFYARKAFPCFDEPAMKARFDITIVRWKTMTSLSNMNKNKVEPRGRHWEADVYHTTLKMSTYLVAFIVGNYEGKTNGKITVWFRPHEKNFTDRVLKISSDVLRFFEDRLQPYAPPKLDIVPVTTLIENAVENWGLIIIHDSFLQYKEDIKYLWTDIELSSVIARKIAHQWFGNLVTPKWWSDVWLSEGVSNYMEDIALKALYPQQHQLDTTVQSMYLSVIRSDCRNHGTVHKTVDKKLPDSQLFDTFTNLKGAVIMRMAHHLFGDDTFWKGLSMYLEKYAYGNAEEKDLWECFDKAHYRKPKFNVTEIMTPWTHRGGLPIVTVERDYRRQRVTFSQQLCNPYKEDGFKNNMWDVPIFYTTADQRRWNPEVSLWLKNENVTLKYMPNEEKWMLVNGQSAGYYIVNYDRRNWNLLANELRRNHQRFPPDQRFKIISDANILVELDYLSIDTVLDLSLYYPKETKFSLFASPITGFLWKYWYLTEQSIYREEWKDYIIYLFHNAYEKIQEKKDDEVRSALTREERFISSALCHVNYKPCVDKAMTYFDLWRSHKENDTIYSRYGIEMDVYLCVAVKYGQNEVWKEIYDFYLNTSNADYLSPLACSRDINIIRKIIPILLDDIKSKHIFAIYVIAGSNHWAELLIYLKENFEKLSNNDAIFKAVYLELENLFQGPVMYEQVLASFKRFAKTLSGWKGEKLKEKLDHIEKSLPRLKKQKDLVEAWLERKPWL